MSTENSIQQLHDDIVVNYKDQIVILKSIVESDTRIIEVYKAREENYEKYIAMLREKLNEAQQQVVRLM